MFRSIEREVSHICLYKKLSFVFKPQKQLKPVDAILKEQDSTLSGERLEKARQKVIEEKRKRSHAILKNLRQGADFAKIARNVSEDTVTSKQDGYVKKIRYGYRHPPYSDSAFSIKTGTCSGVTEDPYGFFIIRADSDPETTVVAYDDIKIEIRRKLDKKKREAAFRKMMAGMEPRILMDTVTAPPNPVY
jgi:hypothetical protein